MSASKRRWAALAVVGLFLGVPARAAEPPPGLPAGLVVRSSTEGPVLADAQGRPVFRLDLDRYARRRKDLGPVIAARCGEACDKLWRPVAAPADFTPKGDWTVVTRRDATRQLAYKGDPIYAFMGHDLAEAAETPIAPSYFSSYTATPVELRDGVPVATVYWHAALYQPPAPAVTAPAQVQLRWMKTAYVFTAGGRPLYQAQNGDCADACAGLEPLAAPLAARAVGAWRPVEDRFGRRCWSYRGGLVYAATDAAVAPPERAWRRLEAR